MKFIDKEHEVFYKSNILKTNSQEDPYRQALFYALGLTEETRNNINSLYDYKEKCINFDGLNAPWQTGTTTKVTRLAFNLYNGFSGDSGEDSPIDDSSNYTPHDIFDNSLMPFMFVAIKLRYPAYAIYE